jgi:hypothetical protein
VTARRRKLSLLALALPALGCIEDRLSVDVTSYVHADGSCTRNIEYRLERVDPDKGKTLEIPPAQDPLRLLHRFPRGERWTVKDEAGRLLHLVTAQATLASPNDVEWDYWRQRAAGVPPARNHVSFAMSQDKDGVGFYEYAESFLDPASPLAGARALAQLVAKREGDFADRVTSGLGSLAPRRGDARRAYRELLAQPFSREVERLAARPLYGPRERKELEAVLDRLEAMLDALTAEIVHKSPVASPSEIEEKLKPLLDDFGEGLDKELQATGMPRPFDLSEPVTRIHFRVTLVMPAAITRANACVQGDTAVWEFDQDDLYGRGFEMWAKAGGR